MRQFPMLNKTMGKRKLFLAITGFSTLALLTAGISLAERRTDAGELFANWYNRKLNEALADINRTFQAESELQIARYRQQLQDKLDQASSELEHVKQEEMRKRLDMLRSYADGLIAGIPAGGPQEREQVQDKLDAILLGAQRAMDASVHNVSVTDSTYDQEPPNIILEPRRAAVTDSVYNKNLQK